MFGTSIEKAWYLGLKNRRKISYTLQYFMGSDIKKGGSRLF